MYSDNQYQQALDNTASMVSSVEDYMKTRYTIEQNKLMREREDNATQRRVDDLKKAGLSPTLAAGSPASSAQGAQPSGNAIGAYLDAKNAIEQLKQNRAYTEQARIQSDLMKDMADESNRQNVMNQLAFDWSLGIPFSSVARKNNRFVNTYDVDVMRSHLSDGQFQFSLGDTPFVRQLQNGLAISNANRDMVDKENAWYNFNQGLNAVSTGVGMGLNAFNTFGSFGLKNKALNQDFSEFQSELNRKQNYDNWRMSPHGESYVNNRGFRYTRSRY